MTPEAINAAIAKITGADKLWLVKKCGYYWRPERAGYTDRIAEAGRYTEDEAKRLEYKPKRAPAQWVTIEPAPPPDFFGSLDAMNGAEKLLWNQNDWSACKYQETLQHRVMATESWTWHATAPQRAEAFLRVFNEWKEPAP
jgi:hypothetical protein